MLHRHASARLKVAKGVVANIALGCPSVGGQRTIELSHRTLSQRLVRASESRMAALAYLDHMNRTSAASQFASRWEAFVADKPSWNLERSVQFFAESMTGLRGLQTPS